MQKAGNLQSKAHLKYKLLVLFSVLTLTQSVEIVGYDFENILQMQKLTTREQMQIVTYRGAV